MEEDDFIDASVLGEKAGEGVYVARSTLSLCGKVESMENGYSNISNKS